MARKKKAAEPESVTEEEAAETETEAEEVSEVVDSAEASDEEEEEETEEAEEEEEADEAEETGKAKKTKKTAKKKGGRRKKAVVPDGFASFVEKSAKTWPGTTVLASETPFRQVPRISTGNIGLDVATFGGWPRGRIIRVWGKEKSAKTGSLLTTVAQWQKHCGACYERFACAPDCAYSGNEADRPKAAALWIDAENRLESMWDWVEGHGIDLSRLLVQSPPDGQHIVDFVDACIREKGAGIGLIVVDSIAHITSAEEIKKATIKGRTAPVNALLLNKAFRKWVSAVIGLGVVETKKPTVILINQIRLTMDQYHPETMPGGEGQKYATSIDVRFSGGKYHYFVQDEKTGELLDRVQTFGSKWKPGEDDQPDFVEVNYRVTASGICPMGRYGQFNYWLRSAHGRRVGDPDNFERLWDYVKRLDLLTKEGRNYNLLGIEATTQTGVKELFANDTVVQNKVWGLVIQKFITSDATDALV